MQTVLIVIHLMVVAALVVVVLLQRSEGGALGIGGGGGGGFFTGRGQANALTRATAILATIFFITSNKQNVLIITIFIATIYISVLLLLRSVETKVVSYYE